MTHEPRYWALTICVHGNPCAVRHEEGTRNLIWPAWCLVDADEWADLRREGFYTRRQRTRPTAYVDPAFQKTCPVDPNE